MSLQWDDLFPSRLNDESLHLHLSFLKRRASLVETCNIHSITDYPLSQSSCHSVQFQSRQNLLSRLCFSSRKSNKEKRNQRVKSHPVLYLEHSLRALLHLVFFPKSHRSVRSIMTKIPTPSSLIKFQLSNTNRFLVVPTLLLT